MGIVPFGEKSAANARDDFISYPPHRPMDYLITGGSGFIGRHLLKELGGASIIDIVKSSDPNVKEQANLDIASESSLEEMEKISRGKEAIFHLAANPEVRVGDPNVHISVGLVGTYHVLEAARKADVPNFVFASSSTVYGDAALTPTPEDYPLAPISTYGAMKVASEALISAYASYYDIKAVSLRLANVVGGDAPRGVLHDFIGKLRSNPRELEVLGDGTQTKSYFHVDDCARGFAMALKWGKRGRNTAYNLGAVDAIDVISIAKITIEEMGFNPSEVKIHTTGGLGGRGWMGDVKYAWLSIEKAKKDGWLPAIKTSEEAVRKAVREILTRGLA
ncbi:MAG: NAD-dependent epimerase/dehydratase family protein [Thermoprotei archaeon]